MVSSGRVGVGIDVGLRALHLCCVVGQRMIGSEVLDPADLETLVSTVARWGPDGPVAVDAPDAWSTAPHGDRTDLPPKFRSARCDEIGLRAHLRIAVPFTTPTGTPSGPSWMTVGTRAHGVLRAAGFGTVETYPSAAFRLVTGQQRLVSARRPAEAIAIRASVLEGVLGPGLHFRSWSIDGLDAAIAAVTATDIGVGGVSVSGCDGSVLALPHRRRWADPTRLPTPLVGCPFT